MAALATDGCDVKKITQQVARSKAVANVLASLRLADLKPRCSAIAGMNACMNGNEATANLLQEVRRTHAKPLLD